MPEIYSLLGFDSEIKSITQDMKNLCKISAYSEESKKDTLGMTNINNIGVVDSYNKLLSRIIQRVGYLLNDYKDLINDFTPTLLVKTKKKTDYLSYSLNEKFVSELYELNNIVNYIVSDQNFNVNITKASMEIDRLNDIVQ